MAWEPPLRLRNRKPQETADGADGGKRLQPSDRRSSAGGSRFRVPTDRNDSRYEALSLRKFCAAHGECHFPSRTAKVKQFATLLESGGGDSPTHASARRIVQTQKPMAHGEKARGVVASGVSGSPSFVAVVQSTDLRHRHDIPHLRRLNRSWLR